MMIPGGASYAEKVHCLRKLSHSHYLFHAHGNNNSGIHNNIPDVLELTYLRKSCVSNTTPTYNHIPLPISNLDFPNRSDILDYKLYTYPFCSTNYIDIHIGASLHPQVDVCVSPHVVAQLVALRAHSPRLTIHTFGHYPDTFQCTFSSDLTQLTVLRTDTAVGWKQDLFVYVLGSAGGSEDVQTANKEDVAKYGSILEAGLRSSKYPF